MFSTLFLCFHKSFPNLVLSKNLKSHCKFCNFSSMKLDVSNIIEGDTFHAISLRKGYYIVLKKKEVGSENYKVPGILLLFDGT